MENEEVSWSGSSFSTASPCSATVLSYATLSVDDSDSEFDRMSVSSCETAVAPLEWVDSLELLKSRCDLTRLVYPREGSSEVVLTFSDESDSEIEFGDGGEDSDWTQASSELAVFSCYQLSELNDEQLLCQAVVEAQKAIDDVESEIANLSCN